MMDKVKIDFTTEEILVLLKALMIYRSVNGVVDDLADQLIDRLKNYK